MDQIITESELPEELEPEVTEEVTEVGERDLLAELEELKEKLERAEQTAREISAGWREFSELYPDVDLTCLPDSFNEAIEKGIPPAAAYALEIRRREVRQRKIEEANRRARSLSSGRIETPEDSLYSPDEVRAMPPAEVRKNMEKIRRSMKSWH